LALGLSGCLEPQSAEDDESGCIPGEEACVCNAGQCLDDLVCLSNLCVSDTDADTDADMDMDTNPAPDLGNDETGEDTLVDGCSSNAECATQEACVEGTCHDTDLLSFDVSVDYFLPIADRCGDGIGDDVVELFYYVYADGVLTFVSPFENCPAEWADVWAYEPTEPLQVEFWEEDIASNDLIFILCWDDGFGECGQVPKEILHDGGYEDFINGHIIELSFDARLR
jgi:hypothetical protein